jgi:hypothetical protein
MTPMTAISQPSKGEAIRLMRGGSAKALMETAAKYVMPICWMTDFVYIKRR